jgi:hypothetical protein
MYTAHDPIPCSLIDLYFSELERKIEAGVRIVEEKKVSEKKRKDGVLLRKI